MTQGTSASCAACGAPDDGEAVHCKYCRQAISADVLAKAIPCPNPACRSACRWGKQKCTSCQAWIVVSCVFCGSISPHNISNCLRCDNAFVGAMQRKQQMQQQQSHQQSMQAVNTWGGVAAVFAGAAVGASIGSIGSHGHYPSGDYSSGDGDDSPPSSNDLDVSNVVDDNADIGGGSWDD